MKETTPYFEAQRLVSEDLNSLTTEYKNIRANIINDFFNYGVGPTFNFKSSLIGTDIFLEINPIIS